MRLPLLLGARPNFFDRGPTVPLGDGEWKIVHDCKDTQLLLLDVDGALSILLDGAPVIIEGNRSVYIKVSFPGTEDMLRVFAESQ